MPFHPFSRVTIVGVGLIGGSLGLALKRRGLAKEVVGVGWRESTLNLARRRGAIDRWSLDIREGVRGADLVVLATRIELMADLVRRARPALATGCLLTDVGSTKNALVREMERIVPAGTVFVGSHPVAGSEKRGVAAAHPGLFEGACCIVTPTRRTPRHALRRVEGLWRALGGRVRRLAPCVHDRILARASHLPHLAAAGVVRRLPPEAEPFVATGFRDTTRVAEGDPEVWTDVCLSNRREIVNALVALDREIRRMAAAIRRGDRRAVLGFLGEAAERRRRIIRRIFGPREK
ncbi:MAG: prephenate dehydrogenase/arogenate dehydrogenase family protein [Planctomycetota bacterium]